MKRGAEGVLNQDELQEELEGLGSVETQTAIVVSGEDFRDWKRLSGWFPPRCKGEVLNTGWLNYTTYHICLIPFVESPFS